jgi:hypothetical protein
MIGVLKNRPLPCLPSDGGMQLFIRRQTADRLGDTLFAVRVAMAQPP